MTRLAHITDLHIDSEDDQILNINSRNRVLTVLDGIREIGIDILVITGDISESTGIKWLFSLLNEMKFEYYLALGNHDKIESFRDYNAFQYDNNGYYSFELANRKIIVLNSSSNNIDKNQLDWMKRNLSDKSNTIIFIHHPVLACGCSTMDQKYPLENRTEVREELLRHNHEVIIFAGHYHNDYYNVDNNITQYVTPSTTVQIERNTENLEFDKSTLAFRVIDINENEYSTHVVSINFDNPTIAST